MALSLFCWICKLFSMIAAVHILLAQKDRTNNILSNHCGSLWPMADRSIVLCINTKKTSFLWKNKASPRLAEGILNRIFFQFIASSHQQVSQWIKDSPTWSPDCTLCWKMANEKKHQLLGNILQNYNRWWSLNC